MLHTVWLVAVAVGGFNGTDKPSPASNEFGPRGNYSVGQYNGMGGGPARPTGIQTNAAAAGGCDSFVLMAAGTAECVGSSRLTTVQQCTDSQASFPPMTLPDVVAYTIEDSAWPTGCVLSDAIGSRLMYWNTHTNNAANLLLKPVCCAKWSAADSSSETSKTWVAGVAVASVFVVAVAGYIFYASWKSTQKFAGKSTQKFAGNFGYSRNLL